jgi:hypothetical protein
LSCDLNSGRSIALVEAALVEALFFDVDATAGLIFVEVLFDLFQGT